uniref:F-box domain-containing protein n=1 Tax=Caenorhabditis tropicalis TaxID=1561998 RepID=A0A1I7UI93_9PELO
MSKFIENHPSAIEVFIFHQKGKERSFRKIYKKLCTLIGENGISEEEFVILFDKVMTEDGESKKKEIRQLVLNNQANLRICILSDVIDKKSMIESFSSIIKMIETHDIDDQDFEFWFNRFSSGNRDLDQKTFFDLPLFIVSNIVESSNFREQFELRNVSHGLRNIVDQLSPSVDEFRCSFRRPDSSKVAKLLMIKTDNGRRYSHARIYEGALYIDRAFYGIKTLLSNPRLRLKYFTWYNESSSEIDEKLIEFLNSLNHKLEIVTLDADSNGEAMYDILKAIKPGTLENIDLRGTFEPIDIIRLANMNQLKEAKYVCFTEYFSEFNRCLHHFQHIENVNVEAEKLSMDDILALRKVFIESDKLKEFHIETKVKPSELKIIEALNLTDFHYNEKNKSSVQMSEFVKNHPSAIEVFIFHQKVKERSFRKMYEKLCVLIGENGISEEEFERIFDKVMNNNEESKKKEIRQLVVNDQANLRLCILSDVIDKKSMIESFLSIAKMIGTYVIDEIIESNVIDYHDFEFWFDRFSYGNRNLDQKKTFSDLPLSIVSIIVEYLDFSSQYQLRKVSRGLRNIVDQVKPIIDVLEYEFKLDGTENTAKFLYTTFAVESPEYEYSYTGEDYLERVFNDMKILLSNRRLRLDCFGWRNHLSSEINEKLIDILNSLNHKIEIVGVETNLNGDSMSDLLKAIKPGTLEHIHFEGKTKPINIDGLFELDQWKQAKSVDIWHFSDFFRVFANFLHFEWISFEVESSLSIENILFLRKIITENANLKTLQLARLTKNVVFPIFEYKDALGLLYDNKVPGGFSGRIDIPGSNDYLEVRVNRDQTTSRQQSSQSSSLITKMIGIHDINELIESKDIDFLDFKFWFNRFSSGNRNLDQKTFSDLPLFLSEISRKTWIFVHSETKLREVSHGLRNIVDQLRLSIDELRCLFTWGSCIPPKNAAFVLIEQKAQNSERRPYSQPGYYNDGDCIERAFYIIKPFLSNPRLRLKNFIWDNELSTDINKELIDILNSLNQKLEIVSLGTSLNGDSLTDLLKAVKPGTLENIELRSNYGLIYVDRLAQLDQWKKAKSVRFAVKMSDFFHHIHHFLHFKRVDITVESASMDDILLSTKLIGKNEISEEEFKRIFEKMTTEDEESKKKEIKQLVDNNQANLRLCILSDVIDKKLWIESVLSITKIFEKIDCQDFKFWFDRFSTGNWNLDQKQFSDFPLFVVSNIVENSDFPSHMRLRRVSHGLRNIVDQVKPSIDELSCQFLSIGDEENNFAIINDHTFFGNDNIKKAFDGLKTLFSNPKLRLKSFKWSNDVYQFDEKLIDILNSLNHKIEIVSLDASSDGNLALDLLKAIKPGTLEDFTLKERYEPTDINLLADLDQWKQAKTVCFMDEIPHFFRYIHHFQHFEKVDVAVEWLTMKDILAMKKVIIESDKLELFLIATENSPWKMTIKEELDLIDWISDEEEEWSDGRCEIPGSDHYLGVRIGANGFMISIQMSKFIENHPSAIEVFIFYEIEKEKSIVKLYTKLWDSIGGDKMLGVDFQKIFDKMMTEDEESQRKEIRQLVVNDPANLRICILSDVIDKKLMIESFLSITKMIGTYDVHEMMESKGIDYTDFDFWFNRFSSGNWNLDQKTFSDLPLFIVSNIAEQLDFLSQTKLRKVSSGLRNIVDQVRPSIDEVTCVVKVRLNPFSSTVECACSQNTATLRYWINTFSHYSIRRYIEEDSLERAFKEIKILLSNPRLRLKRFIWKNELSSDINEELVDMLDLLNHKIEIVSLHATLNGELMIDLLKAIKPGTLRSFSLHGKFKPVDINRLVQLDQWKQAKIVFSETLFLISLVTSTIFNISKREIRQFVVHNQANLRICILSDVIDKKSMIESFLSITKMIGTHDVNEMIESKGIDYQDFEFWFNRFSSGNWNLDQKTFSDLPLFVVSNIAEQLNFVSQMRLRKVSRGLRNIVDQVKPSIDRIGCGTKIGFSIYPDTDYILKLVALKSDKNSRTGWESCYHRGDNLKATFDEMKRLLSNPRLRLERFIWDNEWSKEIDYKFIEMINSLNHKIEIMSLDASLNKDLMIDLVNAVKPGTLEYIEFRGRFEKIHIDRLAQLDQSVQMSKFIENHPSAIEVFVFYEIEKKTSVRNLSKKLYDLNGENKIFEGEFNRLYDKMTMEDKESKRKEIRQLVVNNQANLRICILSDVIDKKSIIESFLSITKMIGTQDIKEMIESKCIDYQDFEFWFNRFSSGNKDLDQKTFSDLPLLVVSNIVENMAFPLQIQLRKVSHGLRNIVDQVKPSIDQLIFEFVRGRSQNIATARCLKKNRFLNTRRYWYNYTGEDYLEKAFNDMKIILSNPRLRLRDFGWDNELTTDIDEKLIELLNTLNHKLEITLVTLSLKGNSMYDLLKAVKPGTLKYIHSRGKLENIDRLAQLDQWKKAKEVYFTTVIPNFSSYIHHFQHFEWVDVIVESVSIDDLLFLKKILTESEKLRKFDIRTENENSELEIREAFGPSEFSDWFRVFSGRYDIPESNDYLELCIRRHAIRFERNTKKSK